ncbi:hypothetical protein MKW92_029206 [Papaver armeniacum]|nr:hypothetical protein MKW92_029206 [Papaver armeniacum]
MPGIVNDVGVNGDEVLSSGNRTPPFEENSVKSHSPMNPQSIQSEGYGTPMDDGIDTSIQHLYDNVCDMQSSDQSPSRASFGSDGDESRIDSELRHLVGGEMREVEIMQEEIMESGSVNNEKAGNSEAAQSLIVNSVSSPQSKGNTRLSLDATQSPKSSPRSKGPRLPRKSIAGILSAKKQRSALGGAKAQNGTDDPSPESVNNPDLGPFLLKQARDLISSGDNPQKALEFALRAAKSFEKCSNGSPSLELVMSLHVVAAIHCNLGQYDQAIKILERSIEIPAAEENQDQALAKFTGHMQLGDTYAMTGQFENSLQRYKLGLGVQKQALGEMDPRVGETCRYLAEALVQALQFEEAEKLCRMALDIHKESGQPASLEEAADRRLMGLICDTKGDYEAALEHLVLASMAMVSNGQEMEVATVDCSIGDTYLSLSRYDEAVFAYQKALAVYKATKGENHPSVASVFVRLADLYNKTGKLRESKSYCENALRIYGKPIAGIPQEEIASGLTDVSAIYESMNEPEQALKLLKRL